MHCIFAEYINSVYFFTKNATHFVVIRVCSLCVRKSILHLFLCFSLLTKRSLVIWEKVPKKEEYSKRMVKDTFKEDFHVLEKEYLFDACNISERKFSGSRFPLTRLHKKI